MPGQPHLLQVQPLFTHNKPRRRVLIMKMTCSLSNVGLRKWLDPHISCNGRLGLDHGGRPYSGKVESACNASRDTVQGAILPPPPLGPVGWHLQYCEVCGLQLRLTGTQAGASGQSPQEHLKAASQHAGMVSFITAIPAGVLCSPGKSIWYGAPMRVGCLSLMSPRKLNHSWKLCAPPPTS